jgi:hypothetical protein
MAQKQRRRVEPRAATNGMKSIVVTIASESVIPFAVSRLRDVGEDIYKEFYFAGKAEVPDMDTAITTLHIHVHKAKDLGDVGIALKKSLRKHRLESAEVSRG